MPGPPSHLCRGGALKNNREDGRRGEDLALAFLRRLDYRLVERNFRTRHGEVDLIFYDGETLVFVEVKLRRGTGFGEPVEAVTPPKQEKLRLVAEQYLAEYEPEFAEARFDVVGILLGANGCPTEVRHIPDAF